MAEENKTDSIEDIHPDLKRELTKIPNFIEVLLMMPPNPAKKTERLNELRVLKAQQDSKKAQSIHDYYTNAA